MKRLIAAVLWLALGMAGTVATAHAALTNVFQTPDGLVDTATNREWLRFPLTRGLSYADITGSAYDCNPTCQTGPFAGWTFAYSDEVRQLYLDAFDYSGCNPGLPIGGGCAPSNGAADYIDFLSWLGDTFEHAHTDYVVRGFNAVSNTHYVNAFDPTLQYQVDWVTECFRRFGLPDCSGSDLISGTWPSGGLTFQGIDELVVAPANLDVWPQSERAVWLFRAARLPEPPSVLLLAPMLALLVRRRAGRAAS